MGVASQATVGQVLQKNLQQILKLYERIVTIYSDKTILNLNESVQAYL